jgi:hypothetical protein
MKIIHLIALLLIISSCKNENSNSLLGSWKLKDVVDYTGQDASDKMTFFENGTVVAEVYLNKKIVTKIKSKYTFDKQNKTLNITGKSFSVTYKVLKLDNDELNLEDSKTHRAIRNIRY